MFDFSCSKSSQEAIDLFVHPGAAWKPYDRDYGEEILLNWTVLYDEPTEAVLIGPNSNFSVVRVILRQGTVVSVEHMMDADAKAFLDQYGCPPDQIDGLYGKHPFRRIWSQESRVNAEGQSLASIIESRSARLDETYRRLAAETVTNESVRKSFVGVLEARRRRLKAPPVVSDVVRLPPLVTASFLDGALAFLAISAGSVGVGIMVALVAGLGAGIGTMCVVGGFGTYLALRGLAKRNVTKAARAPHLEMCDGRIVVPQDKGEALILDLSLPFDFRTDWRMLRGNNSVSYLTRTLLVHEGREVIFYSLDPINKETLVTTGFLLPNDEPIPDVQDVPSFGLTINDHLRLWRYIRSFRAW